MEGQEFERVKNFLNSNGYLVRKSDIAWILNQMTEALDRQVEKLVGDTKQGDNAHDRICLTEVVFLKYAGTKDGNICIEFEYISSDSSINYLEVSYSHPDMEKYVEGNPNVLRNIDAYLRNKLLQREFN